MRPVCLPLCISGALFAQSEAPPKAPLDVTAGSNMYEALRTRIKSPICRCCSMALDPNSPAICGMKNENSACSCRNGLVRSWLATMYQTRFRLPGDARR